MSENWKGRKVLVTGAAGFIGSHLVERLVREGAEVRALVHYNSAGSWGWIDDFDAETRNAVEVVMGNVEDPFSVESIAADRETIFHLAALISIPYSYEAPLSFIRTNVEGTVNVCRAALKAGAERLVVTSTSEVYGTARYTPIDEAHPLQGQSPYSASKIGADMTAESWRRSFGLPVTILRPFNTFGPRQSSRAVIPTIITQLLEGPKIRLGNLAPVRDMNYVEDTVEGFLGAASAPGAVGEVINVGSGRGETIGELARLIAGLMGKTLEVDRDEERMRPDNSEVFELLCSNDKAEKLLGWRPVVGLEEGLRRTIAWTEKNLDLFRVGRYER